MRYFLSLTRSPAWLLIVRFFITVSIPDIINQKLLDESHKIKPISSFLILDFSIAFWLILNGPLLLRLIAPWMGKSMVIWQTHKSERHFDFGNRFLSWVSLRYVWALSYGFPWLPFGSCFTPPATPFQGNQGTLQTVRFS